MGVRGLTTYIAKHSDQFLEPWELKNCHVIIDGNNLASLLYKWISKCNSAFGGDYDKYANCVAKFFKNLSKCGVTALVLFDGAYEEKKLKTVYSRFRNKIVGARATTPASQSKQCFFPLFMKEVFRNVLQKMQIAYLQCDFEADAEIAATARKMNCPVLSFDSDFYVFDVLYIPLSTLILEPVQYADSENHVAYYLSCKIYSLENFLKSLGDVEKGMIPVIATLLGNDYIGGGIFKNFLSEIRKPKSRSLSKSQRRISGLMEWLKRETVESAIEKILSKLKKRRHATVKRYLENTIAGYTICSNDFVSHKNSKITKSDSCEVLTTCIEKENDINISMSSSENKSNNNEQFEESEEETYRGMLSTEKELSYDDSHRNHEEINNSEEEDISETNETFMSFDVDGEGGGGEEEEEEGGGDDEDDDDDDIDEIEDGDITDSKVDQQSKYNAVVSNNKTIFNSFFPDWFKQNLSSGALAPCFVNMVISNIHLLSPQVEDFSLHFAHKISLPIISVIYGLLTAENYHSGNVKELSCITHNRKAKLLKLSLVPEFCTRSVNKFPSLETIPDSSLALRRSLIYDVVGLNAEDVEILNSFPDEWKIFMFALVYWARNISSLSCSDYHIHALLISIIALNIVDKNVGYYRTRKIFLKHCASKLHHINKEKVKEKNIKHSEIAHDNTQDFIDESAYCKVDILDIKVMDAIEQVSIQDCYQVVEKLLPFYLLNEELKTKRKLFSVKVVHTFAQFQSCLLHIMYLNALLNFPYPECKVEDFYSGTLIYNACENFKNRSSVESYILSHVLSTVSTISLLYRTLVKATKTLLPNIMITNKPRKKTKRKRNKKSKNKDTSVADEELNSEESEIDELTDLMSNRFYILTSQDMST